MKENILTVQNLTKYYGKFLALDKISFEIANNEIFALIGPNGAGKSTTLKVIATLLSVDSGSVNIFGLDVKKDSAEIRKHISYLPEEAGAYKRLSGIEYLNLMAGLYSESAKQQKEFTDRGVEISGLKNRLKDKIGSYSKGMTRKLLLARALMSMPKLAILDEPTSGLDVINALEIRNIIKDYAQKGMAVLLSSHNMLEIEYLSERVSIIYAGKIHETGSPKELKSKYNSNNLEEVFTKVVK